jgi:hypothetical protein
MAEVRARWTNPVGTSAASAAAPDQSPSPTRVEARPAIAASSSSASPRTPGVALERHAPRLDRAAVDHGVAHVLAEQPVREAREDERPGGVGRVGEVVAQHRSQPAHPVLGDPSRLLRRSPVLVRLAEAGVEDAGLLDVGPAERSAAGAAGRQLARNGRARERHQVQRDGQGPLHPVQQALPRVGRVQVLVRNRPEVVGARARPEGAQQERGGRRGTRRSRRASSLPESRHQ